MIKDLLPLFPWEGPPLPRGLYQQQYHEETEEITDVHQKIATACIPCSLGHFSTSAGLLNEAVRFKNDGITSNEVLDRIAKILEEQNALERVDLTPEKIQSSPRWERELAEEALEKSRSLRHRLESVETMEDIEQIAADISKYYRELNREWYKRKLAHSKR